MVRHSVEMRRTARRYSRHGSGRFGRWGAVEPPNLDSRQGRDQPAKDHMGRGSGGYVRKAEEPGRGNEAEPSRKIDPLVPFRPLVSSEPKN